MKSHLCLKLNGDCFYIGSSVPSSLTWPGVLGLLYALGSEKAFHLHGVLVFPARRSNQHAFGTSRKNKSFSKLLFYMSTAIGRGLEGLQSPLKEHHAMTSASTSTHRSSLPARQLLSLYNSSGWGRGEIWASRLPITTLLFY